ncbi:hypothetical protein NMF97_17800 [Clostridioides difficile]|uniref:ComEC/Rec2 family competence protein n=1 Tax=Clostridioides difficile TaxID=1496 RepID=UPI0020C52B46|nr:hypothetical protein [Clostridioides difficile]MCP8333547.1 hypothetical protein [Clostridioides difficile]
MSIIKSFSVGNGDSFYIKHGSDNFTIIDCNFDDENKENIVNEIINESKYKGITRFISTHPDEDHIKGIEYLDERINIKNFYCVKNNATKEDESESFKKYKELRDSDCAFYLKKDCTRKWMNISDEERGCAGINILWPDEENQNFKDALKQANEGKSPNNISPIIKYHLNDGVTALWMGDLETDFMEAIKEEIDLPKVNILFAPHHGRKSGKVPEEILKQISPDVVIIGEAKSKDLNYYSKYNTITQNSAGDIIFECLTKEINIYVSNTEYKVDFLKNNNKESYDGYIGTIEI